MTELLRVDHLNKHYPGFALQDVSFSVKPGRIMGLIGKMEPVRVQLSNPF